MGAGPRDLIEASRATPPRVGLLATLGIAAGQDGEWGNGIVVEPEACESVGTFDPCDPGTLSFSGGTADNVEADAIAIYGFDSCSALDNGRDREGRARRALAKCASSQIANELWRGDLTRAQGWSNRYLASDPSDKLGESLPALDALACLEQSLAECSCGERGMIHATRQVVTHWVSANLVRREAGLLVTEMDTIVVPDAGYDGSGPGASPVAPTNGNVWAYATGMVQVRLGQVSFEDQVDRSVNDRVVVAKQLAVVWWEGCCHSAVSIDVDLCGIGGS